MTEKWCEKCPWDTVTSFFVDKKNENLATVVGNRFILRLSLEDSSLMERKWFVRDMGGHTKEYNPKVHSDYHFEITVEPPVENPAAVKGMLVVSWHGKRENQGSAHKGDPDFALRLSGVPTDIQNLQPFQSWAKNESERGYDFRPSHEVFYTGDKQFSGFAFTMENVHVKEGCRSPDWQLRVDTGEFMKRAVKKRRKGLDSTPLRADYGKELEPWQRGQCEPFWYFWRTGKVDRDKESGEYHYRTKEQYEKEGGKEKLKRCGGSGAYKLAGKFPSAPGEKVESNRAMRIGSITEDAVMLAVLLDSPDNVRIIERGWVDHPNPTKDEERDGTSPDGLIFDKAMHVIDVPEYRREKWEKAGIKIDYDKNTLNGSKFTKGLLEIKVSERDDDMRDYYRIQCIWAMRITGVYWARLVKLNTGGQCRSYLMYRDFEREKELLKIVADTKGRVGANMTLLQSVKHVNNTRWLKKMWGSAKWFNEHKDISSKTVRWDHPSIKAYFKYINNVRRDISLTFEEYKRRPDTKDQSLLAPQRELSERMEEHVASVEAAHKVLMDSFALPGGVSGDAAASHIRHSVNKLMELMQACLENK